MRAGFYYSYLCHHPGGGSVLGVMCSCLLVAAGGLRALAADPVLPSELPAAPSPQLCNPELPRPLPRITAGEQVVLWMPLAVTPHQLTALRAKGLFSALSICFFFSPRDARDSTQPQARVR